ncbi:MAG: hypothetical protein KatS3mg065_0748 [Chloroflexota bacterium]|nr:MAG: hypothetical protein KatS3mg065_0748 [Chloroflexota bacterium]
MTTTRTGRRPGPDLDTVAAALGQLRLAAPEGVAEAVLRTLGLADGYDRLPTSIGDVFVAWNGRGISFIDRAPTETAFEAEARAVLGRPLAPAPLPPALRRRLERRLAGDRRAAVPVDLRGRTPFERAVLTKALEIPPGEVRPYGWIAAEIGRPTAVRAVGSALARNPIPLVIPCHRVVRSDGVLGAYSMGGPATKRRLLAAEGADPDRLEALARAGIRFLGSRTTGVFCLPSCRNARRICAAPPGPPSLGRGGPGRRPPPLPGLSARGDRPDRSTL